MLTLLLIRPGETEYDQQGRIQGNLDIPICEDGRRQTRASLDEIAAAKPTVVYTAPGKASKQTGELVADAAGVKTRVLDKLSNLDHGLWQGMLVEEVRNKQPKVYRQWQENPMTVRPPDGEPLSKAKIRVTEALRKLQKRHKEGTIALVSPEPLASVIRHVLQHDQLSNLWKGSERCGMWEAIEMPGEVATVGAA